MVTIERNPLDIVGNAGEGDGLEAWRRLVLELDPRAKSKAAGLMQKLLEFTSDTASFELFDRVPEAQAGYRHQPSGRGEVWAGNVAHAR